MSAAASRGELLRAYFDALGQAGLRWAVLHSYDDLPGAVGHDIDIAVDDLGRAQQLQFEVAEKHGWLVVRRLWHERTAWYSVLADATDPTQVLKLDLCSDYLADGRQLMAVADLLGGTGEGAGGISIPAPAQEFGYLLAKAYVKGKQAGAVLPRLRDLRARDAAGCDQMVVRFCGLPDFAALEESLEISPDLFAAGRAALLKRQRPGVADRLAEFRRRVSRFFKPTGAMVAVLGPDGAGKSTVIDALREGLEPFFRRYHYIHFRPKFRAPGGGGGSVPVTDPQGKPPRSLPASLLKIGYYAADYVTSYWRFLRRAVASSTLIVFDRYYQDILIDPGRYRLRGVGWFARLLGWSIPKPMRYLVLDADPEVIHARKPELPVDELRRQRDLFLEFAQRDRRARVIPTGGDLGETVRHALGVVVEELARVEGRRRR